MVLGWRDLPPPGEDRGLSPARTCAPRLPVPQWAARIAGDDVMALDPAAAPTLTGAWLEAAACETDARPLVADVTCAPTLCVTSGHVEADCSVRLDLSACEAGQGVGRFEDAAMCLELPDAPWRCRQTDTASGALASFVCDDGTPCAVHVYSAADDTPPFAVDRVPIRVGPVVIPEDLASQARLLGEATLTSRLLDLVMLSDRVVVASNGQDTGAFCPRAGIDDTRLTFVGLESLDTTTVSAGLACVSKLAPDLAGDGFFGLYGDIGHWRIGRFDTRGRLVHTALVEPRAPASIPPDSRGVTLWDYWPIGFEASDGATPSLVSFFTWTRARTESSGYLFYRHDPASLAPIRYRNFYVGRIWSVAQFDEDYLIGGDEGALRVGWVQSATGNADIVAELPELPGLERQDISAVAAHRATARAVVAIPWQEPAIQIFELRGGQAVPVARARFFERRVIPTAAVSWDDRTMLVVGIEQDVDSKWYAVAGLLDVVDGRMRPGIWRLAEGAITQLRRDAAGRVWALAAWSGELLRLTPARD